jgi:hypothetical protein
MVTVAFATTGSSFDVGKLEFSVRFGEETSRYAVMLVSALPGADFEFEIVDRSSGRNTYRVTPASGEAVRARPRHWRWKVPTETGLYPLRIECVDTGELMTLNLFSIVPIEKARSGSLNGYRIGDYWWAKSWDRPIYRPPPGLIEVTSENVGTRVSPHFTLRQFLCKQAGGYPKYVVLRVRFLCKLERIIEGVNAAGLRCDTFGILSGYRTPHYNAAIGNVKYSRHVWGGAADIFIDENPRDGMMDDLNQDGAIDVRDARVLFRVIDRMSGEPGWAGFVGGMGLYKKTDNHGPFVHIDTRGRRTRWGD